MVTTYGVNTERPSWQAAFKSKIYDVKTDVRDAAMAIDAYVSQSLAQELMEGIILQAVYRCYLWIYRFSLPSIVTRSSEALALQTYGLDPLAVWASQRDV